MKLSDLSQDIQFMSTTKKQMYSTMVPVTTPRRRYVDSGLSSSLKKSVLEKSLDIQPAHMAATFTKDFKRQARTPLLPQIKRGKSIMMEQWINQILQKDQSEISSSSQPLRAIKKYGMDKATLRNLRLSHQAIDKMYKGLYVYTEGIKNAFKQMLAQTSNMPRQDNFLPKRYFAVFLKLLQNSGPVKSTFKITQDTLIQQITSLKNDKIHLLEELQKEKQNTIDVQAKLNKQLQIQATKMQTLMNDYKIMQATLHMYEVSFNDQVYLRLKFQQKINQAYTCYQQMKVKYENLRQELGYTKEQLFGNGMERQSIKQQLQTQLIKNEELYKQIDELKQKIASYERQIVIKHQQILDIRLINQSETQMKLEQESALDQLINTNKLLKTHIKDADERIKQLNKVSETQKSTIQRLKENLAQTRQKNDELFIKCHDTGIKIPPLENQLHEKELQIIALSKENVKLKAGKQVVDEQLQNKKTKIYDLQNQIITLKKNNTTLTKQFQKVSSAISDLKEVKDRFERNNQKLRQQIIVERKQTASRVQQVATLNAKKIDLEFRFQKLKNQAIEHQKIVFDLKKQIESKNVQFQQRKDKARKSINEVQDQVRVKAQQLKNHKQAYQNLMKQSNKKDQEKLNKIDQIGYLKKLNNAQSKEIEQIKNKLEKINTENQQKNAQIETLRKQIQSKQFTLSKKRKQIDSQVCLLRIKVNTFKEEIHQKSQYVHPMVLQDIYFQLLRSEQKIQHILKADEHMRNTYQSLQSQLSITKTQVRSKQSQINKLNQNIQSLMKQISKLKEQKKNLQKKVKDFEASNTLMNNNMKKDKNQLSSMLVQKDNQIQRLSQKCKQLRVVIQKRQDSLKKALLRPKTPVKQQQTQQPYPEKPQIIEKISTSAQTDILVQQLYQQSTTLEKKKSTKQQKSIQAQPGTISKQVQKRVEDKQFKKALKLTYMRK